MKKQKKIRFSMKYQLVLLCFAVIFIASAGLAVTVLPQISKVMKQEVQNHMDDFVAAEGEVIQELVEDMNEKFENLAMTYETAHQMSGQSIQQSEMMDKEAAEGLEANNNLSHASQNEILQSQIDRYALESQNGDVIVVADKSGKILASSNEGYVGKSMSQDELLVVTSGNGKLSTNTITHEGNKVTIFFHKAIYIDGDLEAVLIYYTSSSWLNDVIKESRLTGIATPRIYVVNSNGINIAHTVEESVGNETENEVLLPVLERIANGETLTTEVYNGTYQYQGNTASVSYRYIPETQWLMVVTTLDKEVFASVSDLIRSFFITLGIILVLLLILIYVAAYSYTKPIQYMNSIINKISNLDFVLQDEQNRYRLIYKRTDEIGDIARSIAHMIDTVKSKLFVVNECSVTMNQSAILLQDITQDISDRASETSAITEELSAGMEETTASTDLIAAEITQLQEHVSEINNQVLDSTKLTEEIMIRAAEVTEMTRRAEEAAHNTFDGIKERGDIAMEQSKAVNKINELANVIMEIADQTSLLALNASIEAARAGEAGRGFAVVADEISTLAKQSSDTVEKITQIVEGVNEAVYNIKDCLVTSQEFVEKNVYTDYKGMFKILDHYAEDANQINKAMKEIDQNSTQLVDTMENITQSVQTINKTIQESAIGVSDIAQRNSGIGDLTAQSSNMVAESVNLANELKGSVEAFRL